MNSTRKAIAIAVAATALVTSCSKDQQANSIEDGVATTLAPDNSATETTIISAPETSILGPQTTEPFAVVAATQIACAENIDSPNHETDPLFYINHDIDGDLAIDIKGTILEVGPEAPAEVRDELLAGNGEFSVPLFQDIEPFFISFEGEDGPVNFYISVSTDFNVIVEMRDDSAPSTFLSSIEAQRRDDNGSVAHSAGLSPQTIVHTLSQYQDNWRPLRPDFSNVPLDFQTTGLSVYSNSLEGPDVTAGITAKQPGINACAAFAWRESVNAPTVTQPETGQPVIPEPQGPVEWDLASAPLVLERQLS